MGTGCLSGLIRPISILALLELGRPGIGLPTLGSPAGGAWRTRQPRNLKAQATAVREYARIRQDFRDQRRTASDSLTKAVPDGGAHLFDLGHPARLSDGTRCRALSGKNHAMINDFRGFVGNFRL